MTSVSIIIPNYNHTRFLAGSIRSALEQTYPPAEVIVVDDGSTDNCRPVVEGFGDQVRYIYQQNQGLAGARNTGIRLAKGDLIGLLDADDEWQPNYLETMLDLAKVHPKAAAFYCQVQCMNEVGVDLPQILGGPPLPSHVLYSVLLRANFIIPSSNLIRREPLVDAGLYDPSLRSCEDWDLWLRLLPEYEVVGTDACLVRYRIHGSSLSTDPRGMQSATRAVIEKHFGPEDGQPIDWSADKRRAYGGVYRYHLLTSIQRQEDWQAGAGYLRRALIIDPTLALDVDMFYDLALGSQQAGFRGTAENLNLPENTIHIQDLLEKVFSAPDSVELEPVRKQTYGSAHYALGLVAYNTGERSFSRSHLSQALYYRPDLWRSTQAAGNLAKSFIPKAAVERAKAYLGRS